jgi:hypothetical protein
MKKVTYRVVEASDDLKCSCLTVQEYFTPWFGKPHWGVPERYDLRTCKVMPHGRIIKLYKMFYDFDKLRTTIIRGGLYEPRPRVLAEFTLENQNL